MNRLLALLAISIIFTSCMGDGPNAEGGGGETSGVAGGVAIYNQALVQNLIALDPVDIAMRLNLLLVEAQKQETDNLDDVVVEIEGKPNQNLKARLFGYGYKGAVLTKDFEKPGVWKVLYPSGYDNGNDMKRFGILYINTGGLLLNQSEASWEISLRKSIIIDENYSVMYNDKQSVTFAETCKYILKNDGAQAWRARATGLAIYYSPDQQSNWNIDYAIALGSNNINDDLYKQFVTGEVHVTGYGSGTTFRDNMTLSISNNGINPLVYKQSCRTAESALYPITKGSITAEITDGYQGLNPSVFPSLKTEVNWTSTGCNIERKFTYNGKTEAL